MVQLLSFYLCIIPLTQDKPDYLFSLSFQYLITHLCYNPKQKHSHDLSNIFNNSLRSNILIYKENLINSLYLPFNAIACFSEVLIATILFI